MNLQTDDENIVAEPNGPGATEAEYTPEPPSSIWTTAEKKILLEHLSVYKNTERKLKKTFIGTKVVPRIKRLWGSRYTEESLKQDKQKRAEWRGKKIVEIFRQLKQRY